MIFLSEKFSPGRALKLLFNSSILYITLLSNVCVACRTTLECGWEGGIFLGSELKSLILQNSCTGIAKCYSTGTY